MNSQHRTVNLYGGTLLSAISILTCFWKGDDVGKHGVSGHKAVDTLQQCSRCIVT
jgi:hypothetical protein